ncbi:MAG: polysaccharide deacetylase family protein [Candidatus Pacebacteria bacterium]|nr:polysaccharide deacetylase family protein [Candidatus Paceibacterota bacterium]
MTDVTTLEEYGPNVLGVRRAIPAMLELFERYDIHVTWAVVGMLTPPTRTALDASLPTQQPQYTDMRYSNYEYLKHANVGPDESRDPYHFGASLLRLIQSVPHQEIGSHTFSHYYCTEAGQTPDDFAADLEAHEVSLRPFNVQARSMVFPRNQWREEYLPLLRDRGFTSFRGNQDGWVYASRPRKTEHLGLRLVRLLDAYLPIFGWHTYTHERMRRDTFPHNIPASFFFRPYSHTLRFFEPLRLWRMKRALTHAAHRGEMVHLWWHPHNFGANTKTNIAHLEAVLKHFAYLRETQSMRSLTMAELATEL